MRKNTLIRVLSLIVAMTCVVVMLCTCSKDKDKKEKEKSEKSEPKSKYAMDVGEFEGKEGEDYTNQVFLFSGIVEKVRDDKSLGVTFILRSEDEKIQDRRSINIQLAEEDTKTVEELSGSNKKLYILTTSIASGIGEKDTAAIVSDIEYEFRIYGGIYGGESKMFQSDLVDVETIDKAYEEEKKRVEEYASSIKSVSDAVDAVINGSMEINRNIVFNGTLDSEYLLEYEKNGNDFSYDSDEYRKTYSINGEEKNVIITLYENDKVDISNIAESGLSYNVRFRLFQYSESAILKIEEGAIGIIVDGFLT